MTILPFGCNGGLRRGMMTSCLDSQDNDVCEDVSEVRRCLGDDMMGSEMETLLGYEADVQYLDCPGTLDAELVAGPRDASASQAAAQRGVPREFLVCSMLPYQTEAFLSPTWRPRESVQIDCPLGKVFALPPEGSTPGQAAIIRFVPQPDFCVRVPAGKKIGDEVRIINEDGAEVVATVPPGYFPGDYFDVYAPSVMVGIPEQAHAGDYVVFQVRGAGEDLRPWYRARLPANLLPGGVMPARIPAPNFMDGESL